MSSQKQVAETYFDGFRTNDHAQILACLTDDVVWDIYGHHHLEGKEAFDGEIDGGGEGTPVGLDTSRLIEEGDTVVALGIGAAPLPDGQVHRFAYATVMTFRDGLICRVESTVASLGS